MTQRTTPLRTLSRAAGSVATTIGVVLVAACGSSPAGTAGGGGTSADATAHAGPHTSSPIAAAQPLRAGERFLNLTVSKPYTPSPPNGGTDDYRCLVVDPHLTTPAFLTGTQFQPQNVPIVHHAIVFAVPPEQAATARAKDAATAGPGLDLLRRHRPGERAAAAGVGRHLDPRWHRNPPAAGRRIPPGARQPAGPSGALQPARHRRPPRRNRPVQRPVATDRRHRSHQAAGHGAVAGADRTALRRRRVRPAVRPRRSHRGRHPALRRRSRGHGGATGERTAATAPRCPATPSTAIYRYRNPSRSTRRSDTCTCSDARSRWNSTPAPPKPKPCSTSPRSTSTTRSSSRYPRPVDLNPGDTLRVTCTHDATLRQQLPALSKLPPRYVVWGDGSSDEMCLGLLTATFGSP